MEKTHVDNAFVKEIREMLDEEGHATLKEHLEQLYPADIAELVDKLNNKEARRVMSLIDRDKIVKVLVEMDEDMRNTFLSAYTPKEIGESFIQNMDSDEAAYVLGNLAANVREEVIASLTDIEYASSLLSLLSYDEHTAGSLMAVELVKARLNWTVERCIEEIRSQAENVETIYVVYVTDEFDRLVGLLTLKNILLALPDTRLETIVNTEVISVSTSTDSDRIANLFKKYDLVVLPVVNALGQLVGRITVDDVVEVIQDEAAEDYQLMSGITEDVDSTDKVWVLSRARLPWLLIGLIGGVASSRFIALYEDQLHIHPEMAFFIPLIAAMGGNAGVQSSAIVVQGLANNTLGTKNIIPKILKELRVSMLNALICSALLFVYTLFLKDATGLSVTVCSALLSVIVFASLLGTFIPLLLDRLDIDPALATGPFITTTNDLLGLVIYFTVGHFLY